LSKNEKETDVCGSVSVEMCICFLFLAAALPKVRQLTSFFLNIAEREQQIKQIYFDLFLMCIDHIEVKKKEKGGLEI
jgi:hypothetical protein